MTQNLLMDACKAIFEDGRFYLSKLTPQQYGQPLDLFSGSSLGQHTRHWIEFFQCLIFQCQEEDICYDKRKRDLVLESDPRFAIQALDSIEEQLSTLNFPKQIILTSGMPQGPEVKLQTSFFRELWFVIEHAVHHLAIIKIGLSKEYPELTLPENFGVACSTLKFQENKALPLKN